MKTPDEWVTWAAPWSQKSSGDLKRAIVERDRAHERDAAGLRRLVEEAQAERDKERGYANEYLAAAHDAEKERDRLKGKLAEMADELAEASDIIDEAMEHCGEVDQKRARKFLAATTTDAAPAEQAQPTERDLDICARPKCKSPRHYNIHDPERGGHVFVEAAEQAQGEAAKPVCPRCKCVHLVPGRGCWDDRVARLAANEPPAPAGGLLDDVEAQVAALAKRVDALEASERLVRIHRDWGPALRGMSDVPAPPPPEAAGPGHVFSCDVAGKDDGECDDSCICEVCDVRFDCHAVPPIAGGANP